MGSLLAIDWKKASFCDDIVAKRSKSRLVPKQWNLFVTGAFD
jgi:hypothetical protein